MRQRGAVIVPLRAAAAPQPRGQIRQAEDLHLRNEALHRPRRGLGHRQGTQLNLLDALPLGAQLFVGVDVDPQLPAGLFLHPLGHEHHPLVHRVCHVQAVREFQYRDVVLFAFPLAPGREPNGQCRH